MIVIRLVGGLGNQLHIFAAGYAVAATKKTELIIDISLIEKGNGVKRKFELSHFIYSFRSIIPIHIVDFDGVTNENLISNYKKWRGLTLHSWIDTKENPSIQMKKIEIDSLLLGHFIDFKWAKVATKFQFPLSLTSIDTNLIDKPEHLNAFNIHVRLGDYKKNRDLFPELPENYFISAIEKFHSLNQPIRLFSDDAFYLRLKYRKLCSLVDDISFRSPKSSLELMKEISSGLTLITSNSTFSTWAAWFSQAKIITTPIPHLIADDWRDGFPASWVRYDLRSDVWIVRQF
jgi:hypothetical protein